MEIIYFNFPDQVKFQGDYLIDLQYFSFLAKGL